MGSAQSIITLINGVKKIKLDDLPNPESAIQRIAEGGKTMTAAEEPLKEFIDMLFTERDSLLNEAIKHASDRATENVVEVSAYTELAKAGGMGHISTEQSAARPQEAPKNSLAGNNLFQRLLANEQKLKQKANNHQVEVQAALQKLRDDEELTEDEKVLLDEEVWSQDLARHEESLRRGSDIRYASDAASVALDEENDLDEQMMAVWDK